MASEEFQPLQGMSDLSSPEISIWHRIESTTRRVFHLYGCEEVRTPVLEKSTVFERTMGDTTDVVQKEMYVFEDRGGRRVALRPEGTAGVMRYIAGLGQDGNDARVYYIGPMFRCERPQAGRKRQFHQLGAELIGPANAAADAEAIAMQVQLLRELGARDFKVQLNTRGLSEDREAVVKGLRALLEPRRAELGEDDQRRLDQNILRVLDTKDEKSLPIVKSLPPMTEFMAESSRAYLQDVVSHLKRLEIDVVLNPRLVRGLDYYMHTVWEITHPALGSQDALAGGGRYKITIGDRAVEGVGFAMGMERLVTALQKDLGDAAAAPKLALIWVVSLGPAAFQENFRLVQTLRMRGVRCGLDLAGRSMKAQMRAADRAGATAVIIRGDTEMEKGVFVFKDMATGTQTELAMPELLERLQSVNLVA